MKSLVENIRINLCNLGLNQGFLRYNTKRQVTRQKNRIKWTVLKLKIFGLQMIRKPKEQRNIANHVSDK